MRLVYLILAYFFISQANAVTLQRIEGIDDFVQVVNFDSDGNTYAGLDDYRNRHILYKISPSKEILWKIDYPADLGTPWILLATSENQLYIEFFNSDKMTAPLAIIRPDSTEIQVIEDDFVDFLFTKDGNDDLLYLKQDGVYILRPNSTTPIPVKNLENEWVFRPEVVDIDKSGNVYMGLTGPNMGKVAVLSNEAQQQEIPSATFVDDHDFIGKFIEDIAVDENNNLWTISTDYLVTLFKKLYGDVLEIVAADEYDGRYRLVPARSKVFVYADFPTTDNKNATIFYFNSNGEIFKIPELESINLGGSIQQNGVADSEGNAYFHATAGVISDSLGPLILINSADAKITPIDVDVSNSVIDFARVDFNDYLWVKTEINSTLNYLYRLKKGETVPEKVNIPAESACNNFIRDVTPSPVTKEIYVSCVDGLYVVVEN